MNNLNNQLEQLKSLLIQVDELMPLLKKNLKYGENNLLNELFVIQQKPGFGYVMIDKYPDDLEKSKLWTSHCNNRDFTKIHLQAKRAVQKITQIQKLQLNDTPIKTKNICLPEN